MQSNLVRAFHALPPKQQELFLRKNPETTALMEKSAATMNSGLERASEVLQRVPAPNSSE